MKHTFYGFFALVLLLAQVTPAIAQTAEPLTQKTETGSPSEDATAKDPNLQSCFDFYRFGSVPITITSRTTQIAQGGTLALNIGVQNENAYPVTDVAVYVKVFYKKDFKKSSFGPDVIDFIKVADHLTLTAGEQKTITYSYAVPPRTEPGNYQIAGYVNASERYNLAGLTFTNDIVGALFNYSVIGEAHGSVRFNNTKTVVSGVGYHAAIFSPFPDYQPTGLPVSVVIENTTDTAYQGKVHWTLYSWDALNPANKISEKEQDISVQNNSSTTLTYTVTDKAHTVYYLVGKLTAVQGKATDSIVTVRFIQSEKGTEPTPRIAFLGTSAYPSVKDKTTAFVCVHSSGVKATAQGKVVLEIVPLDPLDKILHFGGLGKKEYLGVIPGALSALSVPFRADSGNFKIRATLYQNGTVIDSVESQYGCSELGLPCSRTSYWILFAVSLLGLILAGYFLRRRKVTQAPL